MTARPSNKVSARRKQIRAVPMKKTILIALISAWVSSGVSGQNTQSLTFSGPSQWVPGTTVIVDVSLGINYEALGVSYWLEVPSALAPFISISNEQYFTYPDPNQTVPNPAFFNSMNGASSGYILETRDLGAAAPPTPPPQPIPIGPFRLRLPLRRACKAVRAGATHRR